MRVAPTVERRGPDGSIVVDEIVVDERPRVTGMGEVFTHRLRVRYSECDQQGVVFNGHYLFYYDVAVTELWRVMYGSYQDMLVEGHDLVVGEARLRFVEGARFDEELDIALAPHHLGTTSLVIRPRFLVGGRLIADGEVRHVFVDPATKRKKPMPARVREFLGGNPVADAGPGA